MKDKLFLLSVEEYEKYKDRIPKINMWWWLRSPGCCGSGAACVSIDGYVYAFGYSVFDDNSGVRPALRYESDEIKNGRIVKAGYTWIPIDEEERIAIAEMPIMFSRFDSESNDYETSEVRKKLIEWWNERGEE